MAYRNTTLYYWFFSGSFFPVYQQELQFDFVVSIFLTLSMFQDHKVFINEMLVKGVENAKKSQVVKDLENFCLNTK